MAFLKPNNIRKVNGVDVAEHFLTDMFPGQIRESVIGVTIHNTDWITVAEGTTPAEQYTRATKNGNMGDVIVHYYVDNWSAWQLLPHDIHGWHAADGSGDGNWRTIAIECIMDDSNSEMSKKSEDNAARLAAGILKELGLGIDQLYTHQHWYSKKYCPAYILPHWKEFKRKVQGYLGEASSSSTPTSSEMYRIRKSWDDAKSQIGAYTNLDGAKEAWKSGYYIFNSKGEIVYPTASDLSEFEESIDDSAITLPVLRRGDNSQYVESLQVLLIGKGFSCGSYGADHDFGAATESAVKSFQKTAKISSTGICDTKTWTELLKY